jgi:hypothetical protein
MGKTRRVSARLSSDNRGFACALDRACISARAPTPPCRVSTTKLDVVVDDWYCHFCSAVLDNFACPGVGLMWPIGALGHHVDQGHQQRRFGSAAIRGHLRRMSSFISAQRAMASPRAAILGMAGWSMFGKPGDCMLRRILSRSRNQEERRCVSGSLESGSNSGPSLRAHSAFIQFPRPRIPGEREIKEHMLGLNVCPFDETPCEH